MILSNRQVRQYRDAKQIQWLTGASDGQIMRSILTPVQKSVMIARLGLEAIAFMAVLVAVVVAIMAL